jgi:hypothetical protein
VGESPLVAGDPRASAGAFALVVAAEGAAQALGVVYPSLLAAVPAWRGSSLVVGSLLAFGVGVGGTSALYARWTRVDVRFGPPAARPLVLPALGAFLAGVAAALAGGGGAPTPALPVVLNVAVGPALVAATGYGLLYAVVGERARAATDAERAPWVVALAGAVVVAVPFRLPLSVPLVSGASLAFVVTGALVVAGGATAARLPRAAVGGLALLAVCAGAATGVAPVPALAGLVAVGLAAVAYERTRTVPAAVVVLAAFRVVAAV